LGIIKTGSNTDIYLERKTNNEICLYINVDSKKLLEFNEENFNYSILCGVFTKKFLNNYVSDLYSRSNDISFPVGFQSVGLTVTSYNEYEFFPSKTGGIWNGPLEDLIYIKTWVGFEKGCGYYFGIPSECDNLKETNEIKFIGNDKDKDKQKTESWRATLNSLNKIQLSVHPLGIICFGNWGTKGVLEYEINFSGLDSSLKLNEENVKDKIILGLWRNRLYVPITESVFNILKPKVNVKNVMVTFKIRADYGINVIKDLKDILKD
jgi:hypothetical protein